MDRYVFLDPDGTQAFGLLLLVAAPTGVTYAQQCGGLRTLLRAQEGFVIPLGGPAAAGPLRRFFHDTFRGNPPEGADGREPSLGPRWTPALLEELDALLQAIPCWKTYPPAAGVDDRREPLHLDRGRLVELTEAWIPAHTPYGPGILIFANSD